MSHLRPVPHHRRSDFEVAFARLQVALESACMIERVGAVEKDWPAQAAAAIRSGLAWAAANPAAADALTNEALAAGEEGRRHYLRLTSYLAERLHAGREQSAEASRLPSITERALAGGLLSMVARRLDEGRAAELPALGPEAVQFTLTPYIGAEAARFVAGELEGH